MASQVRSVDFLPEIFQTPVNTQFLNATLDQLIQEPNYKQTQGFIGQKVGPGVNPNDYYVVEPTASRNNYQLEPGVISIDPTTSKIDDAITYPGILDALALQGAITNNNSRLFESEYYAWDPFVDFDKFTNYAQYYWLPNGPIPVYVSPTAIPTQETFTVTKENGAYTFSGYNGANPALTLSRNGSYNFNIAQNNTATIEYRVTNNAASSWSIDYEPNPTLTLTRGNTYSFNLTQTFPYKFYIKTAETFGTTNLYNTGVVNNGGSAGLVTFTVPQDAPDTLYYVNDTEFNLRGTLNIIDGTPGSGSKFWIQTQPGVNGVLPWSPNISDRNVFGVTNNGIDLGTVTFAVPSADAQSFYTSMPLIQYPVSIPGQTNGRVDLVSTSIQFNQISGITVNNFFAANPSGIDGVTTLNGKTIVFTTENGWSTDTPFDPLVRTGGNQYSEDVSFDVTGTPSGFPNQPFDNVPFETVTEAVTGTPSANDNQPGAFDTWSFDQATPVDPADYYSVWQIIYTTDSGGSQIIQLLPVAPIENLSQFTISSGATYVNTNWYKDSNGLLQQMPLLTASLNTLFYQDSEDPNIFGTINLINENLSAQINVDTDILGQATYTSPNGIKFTNGLQVIFSGNVIPTSYQNNAYYVEGVGSGIKLLPVTDFATPEVYTQTLSVPYDEFPYDSNPYNPTVTSPLSPDYLTINRASPDLNPWTRSNRWFHIDVILQSAAYNNTAPLFIKANRANRPILEFRAGTNLFNFGTQGIPAVDIIDFSQTNALRNVNGSLGYSTDGYTVSQGSTIIFAVDNDPEVRNQIYTVNFIVPDPQVSTVPIIDLVPTSYSPALPNQVTVCLSGITETGMSYLYNGTTWVATQQKTAVNQAPLFDVYNSSGYSFGDTTQYPSSNFTGCKLISYTENPDNPTDPVLGIPLSFFYINNIGDIEFTNNLYTDTFIYTPNNAGVTVEVSSGFVRQYSDRLTFTTEIGWQTAAIPSEQRQQFQFSYDGTPLQLDILVTANTPVPAVQVFINDAFQPPSTYTVGTNPQGTVTVITLTGSGYNTGDIIEVLVLSDQISTKGFYEVPINLENNPFNGNSKLFTLGTVRSHYATICENLLTFQGEINGQNNTRDLGNIIPYGQQILQQSSPLTLAGYFLRSNAYNIFYAMEYNSREYIKYKNKLLTAVTQLDIQPSQSISSILDQTILNITQNLTSAAPFYWSDMLPSGTTYTSNSYTVNPITTATFNTTQMYDFTTSNYLGLLVYVNGVLLLRGTQYTVSTTAPKLTILIPLNVGDIVTINEYSATYGSYVPNTPSKMGLYPKYEPEIYLDETYVNPTPVIRGHDGSITIAFGDIRDQVLLEFEKRIYDNIKVDDNPIPLTTEEIDPNFFPAQTTALLPGFFRTTPYTWQETNQILSESFLTWVGQNKVDYTTQDYQANNPFTWNYSQAANRINGEPFLQGNWRGIYRYFYDTETPTTTPWEMLGFSEEPAWWMQRYGPAPYTSGNTVLWDDLAAGLVADPAGPYILVEYARPGLLGIIPADSEGNLLPPSECVMGRNNPYGFQQSWAAGDGGPTEASWWNSSSYPFAIMRLLALTKPAQFFALYADRDLYRYNTTLGQYLYNGRYRLDASGVQVYGNGVSKASYINWIVDYNRQSGINSTTALTADLANLDVRLCYRMASFSDQQYITLTTERAGPGSTNNSLVIPASSYNVLFYKNEPFNQLTYSAVIVEQTQLANGAQGYTVYGYSNVQPYFEILVSSPVGIYQTISAGNLTVQVPSQYTTNVTQIPYGHVFTNPASVCDFILSYGAYLESQGLIFDDTYNGYTLNWKQMANEFLYFAGQGWTPGTLINLNPCATTIKANQPISIVDTIASITPENMLLDQYQHVLDVRNMIVNRDGDQFSVTTTNGQTISYLTLKFTNYEDMIVVDNTSQFNDLIYDPITAARQIRLNLRAYTTTQWDGQLNAQGFILNLNNVQQWQPNTKYTKGEIVLYKNTYWQAIDIVQPVTVFNQTYWVPSNYQLVDQGLLVNLANKANQLANTYNVYNANIVPDDNLFAFGLIGFRPRQYMTDMNLDIITQVQLYQQFIGTKGTLQAAELFNKAQLGKESGDYQIYENWAILAGTYGAQANRSFFEIALNEALLQYNPSTIQIINPGDTSQANQTVFLNDLWKESYRITSTNILPTTLEGSGTSTGLPTAGYVSLDDVDITVFSIENPTALDQYIDQIGIGTYVWIAKINPYNWGVYRVNKAAPQLISLTNNLKGSAVATFNGTHGLSVGDLIVIKYFNSSVNGVYRVLTVPSITTITVEYNFTNTNQTTITGTGVVFQLQNARVGQASDISTLSYVNNLIPGEKVWIDNNGSGLWEVVEKQSPFTATSILTLGASPTALFGASTAQTINNFAAMVGAPGQDNGAGLIYTYLRNPQLDYTFNTTLSLGAQATGGFGNMMSIGNQTWGVIGASGSLSGAGYAAVVYRNSNTNNFVISQLLLEPTGSTSGSGFGTSGVVSTDEQWMYIGAPGSNKVYAYERVDIEPQTVSYKTDGATSQFNYSNTIQINYANPDQLLVTLNNRALVYNIDYTITNTSVVFDAPLLTGQTLTIARNQSSQLNQTTYYSVGQNSTTGIGVGATFTVTDTRGVYNTSLVVGGQYYTPGDVLTIDGVQIGGATPANDITITVTNTLNGAITAFTSSGNGIGNQATFTLSASLYTATSINSFSVTVNGQTQRPNLDYTFDPTTTQLTFASGAVPAPGAKIIVTSGTYWQYVTSIAPVGAMAGDKIGYSLSTTTDGRQIIIGAPGTQTGTYVGAGQIYVYDRSVVRYQVTNTATTTYNIPGPVNGPIAVSVNGTFLLNTEQSINGQYTISGSNVLFSNITFTVGDNIEIGTNQFTEIQQLNSYTPNTGAAYGYVVDSCPINCSIYVGAPNDSTYLEQAGSVDHVVNQSRVYGVTTSTIANPTLPTGYTLRINDIEVTTTGSTVADLANVINNANIPNVIATVTPDATFIADGHTQTFDIGSLYSAAASYTTLVYANGAYQAPGVQYTYNPSTQQIIFVVAPNSGTEILVVSGRLTISVINGAAAPTANMLTVLPGTNGNLFNLVGFDTFVFTQQILSPAPTVSGQFGTSLSIDTSAVNLIVGSPNGNVYEPTTFDAGLTYFDEHSTTFYNPVLNGGVAYTYDYFPSKTNNINNPGQFAFGQQIYSSLVQQGDRFGISVNFTTGKLMTGALGSTATGHSGYVNLFDNPTDSPSWKQIRIQQPVVDVYQLNSVFSYNKLLNSTQTYFDFFDPLQGKILGVARSNINYIGAVDPADYNAGSVHNNGNSWGPEHIGEMWWDTDTVRFIDPNQDDIVYASRKWGGIFPGSRVDIYQWVESSNPPASYTGQGTPLSTTSYTVSSQLGQNNIFNTLYYFWVRGITTIASGAGKTLSASGVASYITDPRSSGLPYIAALNSSTIAIYNARSLLSAQTTILSVGFDQQLTDANVHQEYQLIPAGVASAFLNPNLYRKFQDSLCGTDTAGQAVPDPTLSPGMQIGVQFRPRQTMFLNRFTALENYLGRANTVLAQYPIREMRSFNLLNSTQPIPSAGTGAWDMEVANLEILGYQNLAIVPIGYKYLVLSDSSQAGRWTIYELGANQTLTLIQVQSYDTPLYWYYINWYLPGYNSSTATQAAVVNYAALSTLSYTTVPIGASARVTNNGSGKWEIYQRTGTNPATDWIRVGLEDGTIQFSEELWNYSAGGFGFSGEVFDAQYFDQEPTVETRYIIRALNEEIYIDELLLERNSSLMLMFTYAFSESTNPEWLIKTSYVDVDHTIRQLLPYQTYAPDNQTFVTDYFQEVKPYHVQTRQFNLIYPGSDTFLGDLTDYDLPSYYDLALESPQYVSPILTPYDTAITPHYSTASDAASDAQIWLERPWSYWYNNYLLSLTGVTLVSGGSGYTVNPTVTVSAPTTAGGTQAVMSAIINGTGQVISIIVTNSGSGYVTTPTITIVGGNGNGAVAVPQMSNPLVRSIKTTIKYDRYEYSSNIVDWVANTTYNAGTEVRYKNQVWSANDTVTNSIFDPNQWTFVPAISLSGVNRTMGYYVSTANEPGLNLPLLIDGIDYPGVQVAGLSFYQDTGFSRGGFDDTPWDNYAIGPNGQPTYSPTLLDTIYASSYRDTFLGTRPADINVSGWKYISEYASHAPQELVPGAMFDTLDMRVYTTPGADWQGLGHGFPLNVLRTTYTNVPISFAGQLPYPFAVEILNQTTQAMLNEGVDYNIQWSNQTIIFNSTGALTVGQTVAVYVYELGGGNQLLKDIYNITGNTLVVPVEYSLIEEFAIFVNGTPITNFTFSDNGANEYGTTLITFTDSYTSTDFIALTAIGPTNINGNAINYSWSTPLTEYFTGNGSTTVFDLANSLEYNNPVNAIVNVNGQRIQTPGGVGYVADGATTVFAVPNRLAAPQSAEDTLQQSMILTDIAVYVDEILIDSSLYSLQPWLGAGTTRTIRFTTAPIATSRIYVVYLSNAQATIDPITSTVNFITAPAAGSVISVTTWNDTREQRLETLVFTGPASVGVPVTEGFDTTTFDAGTTDNEPGSYDYSAGGIVAENNLYLGRIIDDASRLWVTLDTSATGTRGRRLSANVDYTLDNSNLTLGSQIILSSGLLQNTNVVIVTMVTNSVVPEALEFRIFQDMRGQQLTYRMTTDTTTTLTQDLSATADTIHVENASALSIPDVSANVWGVLTVNGERIMYRDIDLTANTVSSLLRGTAGTGAASHLAGTNVYNLGVGNLLPAEYQNYIIADTTLADGTTTTFIAKNITETFSDSALLEEAVQVYVGGTLVTSGYAFTSFTPVTIEFTTAPANGSDVIILIKRGVTWYQQGAGTASNGVPLQETETIAARFFRGL